ncbi:MAG: [Lachnospiraceae bacterium]|nr:[FeFe] hydrogenase H-cluster radical SAM maturase HydE [Lachnospiraceae bacterium]
MNNTERIGQLKKESMLGAEDLRMLLTTLTTEEEQLLYDTACEVRRGVYGTDVYLRGLIEFSSYCRNNCLYCGLRRGNEHCERYRLETEEILECADRGYELGFRTIVLQSGEDLWYSDDKICSIVSQIKERHPDIAVTLSIGEKSRASYQAYFDAGADRYLLRHETYNAEHYRRLHPKEMSRENRIRCLHDLKDIGYQVGCGIMVGSPYQTADHIVEDLLFMRQFHPQMVGIGPFIPHKDTPFRDMSRGTLEDTLHLLAITRLLLPDVLLPATTALGTIDPRGREKGILAGANVVMPNLSPSSVREKYMLYDGKICTGDEAAECRRCMEQRISSVGYRVVVSRGDWAGR